MLLLDARLRHVPFTLLALASAACEPPAGAPGAPETSDVAQPIIEGSRDADHPAVVWLFDSEGGFSCTGTIIAVNGMTGYVLTAAHCADMKIVAITTDYRACFGDVPGPECQAIFKVDEQVYHPTWTGDLERNDFSMIRFLGASPSTPVIPAAASDDGVIASAETDVVGFGETESGDNSLRNHKTTEVASADAALLRVIGTTCYGDSGGPAIIDGRVVGVTSFGTSDSCYGDGFSGRVQYAYDALIGPYLEQDPIVPACDECLDIALNTRGGPCGDARFACEADAECAAIEACQSACLGNAGCEGQCVAAHPAGAALHDAIYRCVACDVCVPSCGEDPGCDQPPPTATVAASSSSTGVAPESDGAGGGGGAGGAEGGGKAPDPGDEGCAVAAPGAPSSPLVGALTIAALALSVRRRRV